MQSGCRLWIRRTNSSLCAREIFSGVSNHITAIGPYCVNSSRTCGLTLRSKYFERKVKPQVRELLTQYGPIAVMWFDTPEKISRAQSEELVRLIHSLQPDCIVNARVGNRLGDYAVQEQKIPDTGDPKPWETCMTLNNH